MGLGCHKEQRDEFVHVPEFKNHAPRVLRKDHFSKVLNYFSKVLGHFSKVLDIFFLMLAHVIGLKKQLLPSPPTAAASSFAARISGKKLIFNLRGILSGTCSTMGDFSIQISSNLVDKLVHDAEKSKRKPRRTKIKGTGAKGWPLQPPIFVPVTPPSQSTYAELDAIRSVLQESGRVLERLQKQEENMVHEVTQRAKELRDKEFKLPFQKPMPCLTEKDACLACYKEHADNPLKCAGFVKSFEDCARRIRQQVGSAEK
ncbi:hypothetical protein L3X38_025009 [Prunus dulcis]|uniref:Uncharacterized protein n=1 Tax=Prunus dulcis TaxID=3755 RepID=A0AAD4W3C9_PRUDU|nr:hypothetical protein L3X38_025009 [Prunus dulcis]